MAKKKIGGLKVTGSAGGNKETNSSITNGLISMAFDAHQKDNYGDWDDVVDAFNRSDYKCIIMRLSLNLPLHPNPFLFFKIDTDAEVCDVHR